ncbi:MAG TPA: DNA-3-methyladenine glycosylase 2 family protein [Acidimicrobiia bacterium]|nr:DNA-3-methyladenine glycosylase 2 family protein [Acidimicrobiia bacterium]
MQQDSISIDIPLGAPLDLRATLQPATSVWGRWTDSGWLRPMRTPDGPATLLLHRRPAVVHAEAWGPGAAWIIDRAAAWAGLDDDPAAFTTDHPLVRELHRRQQGRRFCRTGLVFEAALAAVVSQKVTGKEAASGLRGLMRRFSDPAPGPFEGLLLPPEPAQLAAARYHDLHELGIERRRAETVRVLAREAARMERLSDAPSDRAARWLRSLPGVGVWTVAETLAVSHGDADALSVGDYHLRHLVVWHLTGRPRGTDEEMVELLEPFRPHRGRVVRLLEAAGRYPAFGPRAPVRSFAGY